jgi:DNA-binding LacI/PurR family transcriptional regulator
MKTVKRPTLEDVAKVAGVSRATVSRVVRKVDGVKPEIVEVVTKAIQETGFKANLAARALAGGSTQTIGVVFRENFGDLFRNAFWGEVLQGIYEVFSPINYQLTFLVNDEAHMDAVESYLFNGHVDGVLILSLDNDDKLLKSLVKQNIPVVSMGRPGRGIKISFVESDDHAGGYLAAEKLVSIGCKKIGLISGREDLVSNQVRISGFEEALNEAQFDFDRYVQISGGFTTEGAYEATKQLLHEHSDIDGLYVLSDLMGLGVMEALYELNIQVPQKVSLISHDNSPHSLVTSPKMTSIGFSSREYGNTGAGLLLDVIAGKPMKSVTFNPFLAERGSTKRKARG